MVCNHGFLRLGVQKDGDEGEGALVKWSPCRAALGPPPLSFGQDPRGDDALGMVSEENQRVARGPMSEQGPLP